MEQNNVSLRDFQIKLLEVIDYIDSLCKENDIQYYLIGGSALGAIRHKGFIPWDDDFDIAMTWDNYSKFIKICDSQLDNNKYFLQKENSEYWPLYYTKIKMNNTVFKEKDAHPKAHPGIFVDVFCLDNISDNFIMSKWQYICSKVVIAQTLSIRGYISASYKKRVIMSISNLLATKTFKRYFINQVRRYNSKRTRRVGLLFGKIKYKTGIIPKEYLGKGRLVEFEGRMLPVPEKTHEYLEVYFGDYMKLPPEEHRIGHLPDELKI